MATFEKIMIANRGEIARRIIRTCRKMGIKTVAVYSEADLEAPYVEEADEAVCIGPAQAKKSYLDIEKIIQAARESEADAIHPGYGFLSENPQLVRRCEEENIVFIGPDALQIERMGSKIEARLHMKQAGVPVVPGWDGKLDRVEDALSIAEQVGYPIMLKASAGGGGIGMQLIHSEADLRKSFASTMQRASSSFGDGTLFIEKWIENPHHIEVQVACDAYGNAVHLFERECSVQRRNQKIIEETPSPFLDPLTKKRLLETALAGVKHIGYKNVGTMEFIMDEHKNFYFLEMNTRLQVEHPITEETTGIDLVELQIRLAEGEKLPFVQSDIQQTGHSIECRLYAEDPKTFFPSPGTIQELHLPDQDVRLDFAVKQGTKVSPFYDPMIGKIITHASTRELAIEKMKDCLKQVEVHGITTNLLLLEQVMGDRGFIEGNYTTRLVESVWDEGGS
ncbi:acetyl/propionyl/methylcrotonyl-CoA carboxylase subunit alpha [Ammoniphilus sp. CFH 90114]|uniref:acetyl-CoA carboxylase biotin carboxylase subunit n=1 Tax=Ammoniphilus sp. CFH 90114 TaxID=2493665 RepID=UPI00100FED2B|nr:acetyl-CoA carboxylase biotin carboxylase subunit [Ammoniphilus sp. CFH 90114]RXT06407.1 acetyl-CoA carboxylase biotin carboxylase subunit [Ammoniphilus sp. CFH 90114]